MTGQAESEARFFNAIRTGDLALVQKMVLRDPLLLQSKQPNEQGAPDKPPLHVAAVASQPDILGFLIERGAQLESTDLFGMTPLMYAAQDKEAAMVTRLLTAGADPFHNTKDNMTPLMFATMAGNLDAIEILLKQGISPNAPRDCGMVALHFARHAKNRLDTVCLLVNAGADTTLMNNALETPAMLAARMGDATYADTIRAALRQKEIKDAAKALLDQQDRNVLEQGLPAPFTVRRSPLRLNVRA